MRSAGAIALAVLIALCASVRTKAAPFFVAMDRQIDIGLGPAIGPDKVTFASDSSGGFARFPLGGGDYYWGPVIDLVKAGLGSVDLSDPNASIEFDARYYQDPANYPPGTPSTSKDAPIGVLLMSPTDAIAYGYPFHSGAGDPLYPTWVHVTLYVNRDGSPKVGSGVWWGVRNLTGISSVLFWGTDWVGKGSDFIDVRNFRANPKAIPEIDPVGMGSVLAVVGGALGLLERRRSRPL